MTPLLFLTAGADHASSGPAWCAAGDVSGSRARIAAGGLGFGQLRVDWSTNSSLATPQTVKGSRATAATDGTAQASLSGLSPETIVHYRARIGERSVRGQFRTPPTQVHKKVTFLWGGDVVGQGWGIDPRRGGMRTFQTMLDEDPDFFIHCGDSIYADKPLKAEVEMPDGSVWRNLMTPEKSKAAESLSDFQGCFRYNFLDAHYRRFFQKVPVVAQWDDHEVLNNWDPLHHSALAQNSWDAFRQYWPIGRSPDDRLYRKISYGPNLDVFVLDLRSYRAPNSDNRQEQAGEQSVLLGRKQLDWFKKALRESRATWKVVAGEMPLATYAPQWGLDSWANGEGPVLGREHELAEILSYAKEHNIQNVAWISADVHYAMAIRFEPESARFKNFSPFWEFIAGPLHAGTFCPTEDLDPTFGPREVFCAVPRDLEPNRPPDEGLQFYGKMVAGPKALEVSLHKQDGTRLYKMSLPSKSEQAHHGWFR